MKTMIINVVSAYGRNYSYSTEAIKDWENNKDFKIVRGPYINKSDWRIYSVTDTVVFHNSKASWLLQNGD